MSPKEFLLFYCAQWKETYGTHLSIPWSKAAPQAARLLKSYSSEELVNYVRHYFLGYQSSFANRTGRSLGAFVAELPAIIASYTEEQRKRNGPDRSADMERLATAKAVAQEI